MSFERKPGDVISVGTSDSRSWIEVRILNEDATAIHIHYVEVDENGFLKVGRLKRTIPLLDKP